MLLGILPLAFLLKMLSLLTKILSYSKNGAIYIKNLFLFSCPVSAQKRKKRRERTPLPPVTNCSFPKTISPPPIRLFSPFYFLYHFTTQDPTSVTSFQESSHIPRTPLILIGCHVAVHLNGTCYRSE